MAVLLVHGRGGSATGILDLGRAIVERAGVDAALVAPQAADHAWYPNSFLAPLETNEPGLGSGLVVLGGLVERLRGDRPDPDRVLLAGFSQGACLLLEHAVRRPRRYGGLIGLSGGLVGPDGAPRAHPGSLAGTPVLLGCSDVDPHIPRGRVEETARILAAMGADVDARFYPGLGHTVNDDELDRAAGILRTAVGG